MKIAVLVKQVPDTNEIQVDKANGTLIREGIPTIINPDDLSAVEVALQMKETYGAFVHVFTMGPKNAVNMLKELYARGVDQTTLLTDRQFAGSDTWSTSLVLSTALKQDAFDLIIAGRQAIDGDTAQVGAQVAEFVDIPHVSYVDQIIDVKDKELFIRKQEETQFLKIKLPFPCLITVLDSIAQPRYMNMVHIFNQTETPIHILDNNALSIDPALLGIKGSPTRVKKTFTKEITKKQTPSTLDPYEAAERIVNLIYKKAKGAS